MSTIVTRAGKGSALTHNEVDANFTNLNTDKVEKSGTDPVVISVNSTSDALRITQVGTGNALVVEDSTNPDSTPFVINASGNTGIGTSSPGYRLDVFGGTASSAVAQFTGLNNNRGLKLSTFLSTNNDAGVDLNAQDSLYGTLTFSTRSVERMRIDLSGNVGIGTTAPGGRLHISNSSDGLSVDVIAANTFYAASSTDESVSFQGEFYQNDVSANRAAGYLRFAKAADFSNNANASANMIFATRNAGTLAEKMRIDSAGNLGLGVTPSAWQSTRTALQIGARGSLSSVTGTTTLGNNLYNDGTNWVYLATAAAGMYQVSANSHLWYVAPSGTAGTAITWTQVMTLDASGRLLVGVTSANANGGILQLSSGITFPATQVAATDANTLDDYEEGTFTPTIVGTTTAGTGTYTLQIGRYTKIGNRVYFTINITWTAHTGTGNMRVSGLPFTSNNTTNNLNSLSVYPNNVSLTASNYMNAYVIVNSTQISIDQAPVGGGAASNVPIDTSANIIISGQYEV